jgi:uncharacterized protein YndB with AHSA1/START domain
MRALPEADAQSDRTMGGTVNAHFRQSSRTLAFLAISALLATTVQAAVTDSAPEGFALTETAHIAAPRDKVYAALIEPSHWWSSAHSFSGNAANLTFDARAGSCWCETLPGGGSAEHLIAVYVVPGETLRLKGALGPFQSFAVDGVMTWTLKDSGQGTDLTLTYLIGGYMKGGFENISKAADGVLAEQVSRLQNFVETGSPDKHS